ncbi:MAG: hypothetical protein UT24_C0037G0011 [Candidatus Woesebacteria bacterium GW2011_GWB1_39_12]|uniref:Uncharacterized protein n=1 Tax=Candidatus Woesebacteria bacterium GW2011_GWB1_39_12 TaxID=1618574 RepID=A0A0G0M633_9BACT|nr:MAG: hypothetical protein UT24_C0037G0011 [Candidatus Woesebacteria bacterium GW2011_GWB1_39_12]
MTKPKCPKCTSFNFFYVTRSIEYWYIESMPTKKNFCELREMKDAYHDDSFTPFLQCDACGNQYDMKLKKMDNNFKDK